LSMKREAGHHFDKMLYFMQIAKPTPNDLSNVSFSLLSRYYNIVAYC
jgi:hypothetical protein